jgi:dTMP kinase
MNKKKGRLFVFEGPDGVGKSELAAQLTRSLSTLGYNPTLLAFPGNEQGTLGRLVYDIHHYPDRYSLHNISSTAVQALHIAAHLDVIEQLVVPAMRSGRTVVLDRYWWSTWVYGVTGGVAKSVLSALIEAERAVWAECKPTAIFLIRRQTPLRPEPVDKWQIWAKEYAALQEREVVSEPVYVVTNEATIDDALDGLLAIVSSLSPR